MENDYQQDEHRVHQIVYHLVRTPKRRKPVLVVEITTSYKALIEKKCPRKAGHSWNWRCNPVISICL
jgi:REP-associated tyrosine transposase